MEYPTRLRLDGLAVRAALGVLVSGAILVIAPACQRAVPNVDPSQRTATGSGTVSGTVRERRGASVSLPRTMEATNMATGERRTVQTDRAGGYSFKLPPGRYHVGPKLRPGETFEMSRAPVQLDRGEFEAGVDFVVSGRAAPAAPRRALPPGLDPPFA